MVIGYGATGQALIDAGIDYCVFTGARRDRAQGRGGVRAAAHPVHDGARRQGAARRVRGLRRRADRARHRLRRLRQQRPGVHLGRARVRRTSASTSRSLERVTRAGGRAAPGRSRRRTSSTSAPSSSRSRSTSRAEHVDDALKKGARARRAAASRCPGPGQFFEPTVLADCDHTMTVMREEIFGPVVPFMRVASDDEAVALANDSHLGLNAYVFTRDRGAGAAAGRAHRGGQRRRERRALELRDRRGALRRHQAVRLRARARRRRPPRDVHAQARELRPRRAAAARPLWFPYTAKSFHWLQRGMRLLFGGGSLAKRIGELF